MFSYESEREEVEVEVGRGEVVVGERMEHLDCLLRVGSGVRYVNGTGRCRG